MKTRRGQFQSQFNGQMCRRRLGFESLENRSLLSATLAAEVSDPHTTVQPADSEAPVITSADSANFHYGAANSYSIIANGTAPITYSEAGTLPSGISLDSTTGVLSGSPTVAVGTYSLTLEAHNSAGDDYFPFTLTISDPSAITVVDRGPGYSETGPWFTSGVNIGYDNTPTRWSSTPGSSATWTPTLTAGYYLVNYYNPVYGNESDFVQPTVTANGVTSTYPGSSDGGFINLGVFYFSGDGTENVAVNYVNGTLRSDEVVFSHYSGELPPSISIPAPQSVYENSSLVFSAANHNSVTLSDPDGGSSVEQLKIATGSGTVTLPETTGLTFTVASNGGPGFTVQGTLAALNAALDGLKYTPNQNISGSDVIQFSLNDLSSAAGGPLTAYQSLPININPTSIVVVDGQAGYSETSGVWTASGLQGASSTPTRYSASAGATAVWTPTLTAGNYTVSIYNVVAAGSSTSAQVTLVADGQTIHQTINQVTGSSGFVTLGAFYFSGGGGESATLQQLGSGYLRADEVVFTHSPAAVAIVDGAAGYSETSGTWSASSLKGADGSSTRYSATAAATAVWTPTLAAGNYTVSFYNVVAAGSASAAQLSVTANGVTTVHTITQATGSSGYISLGTFYFSGAGNESVSLKLTGSGNLRADKVVFTPLSG